MALAFLQAGAGGDAAAAYEAVSPALAGLAGSVRGGATPAARAAACTALAVGAYVVGDVGGQEVVEAAEVLAGAAASRVVACVGVGGTAGGGAPSAVAAAALRGLALLSTVAFPSQAAGWASDGRVLRVLGGALTSADVDVRHAAGLAAVAMRGAGGGGAGDDGSEEEEEDLPPPLAALGPTLARVRGLASSSHAALDRLGGGSASASGAATPTGRGGGGAPLPPPPPPLHPPGTAMPTGRGGRPTPPPPPPPLHPPATGFRCAAGLRLSRAARTEQRRLFRELECMGGAGADVRAAVLKRVAGPGWRELSEARCLGGLFNGGRAGAGWGGPGGGGGQGQPASARARERARARGRAGAVSEAVACLVGEEWG